MKRLTLLTVTVLGCLAQPAVGLYQWTDENGQIHYSDKPPQGQARSASSAAPEPPSTRPAPRASSPADRVDLKELDGEPPEIDLPAASYTKPGYSDALRLRRLYQREDFAALNRALDARLDAVKKDLRHEPTLQMAYYLFARLEDPAHEKRLARWIEQYPDNYQGYLARAQYRHLRGWDARGAKYANETPQENFRKMRIEFSHAMGDLKKALAIEPAALNAYLIQIDIAQATSDDAMGRRALKTALKHHPASYMAPRHYIENVRPLWGGSLEQVAEFARRSQARVAQNPRLEELQGYAFHLVGRKHYREDRFEQALNAFTHALQFGPNPVTLYMRGKTYHQLDQYEPALRDLTLAIDLKPDAGDYHRWRSYALYNLDRFSLALKEINRAHALEPGNEHNVKFRERLCRETTRYDIAKIPTQKARSQIEQKASPYDEQALHRNAMAYLSLNQNQAALELLQKLIKLKPNHIDHYRLLDFTLFRLARLEKIVEHWDAFIRRNPDNGAAYFERAGTKFHLQDYPAARRDAQKAVQLGESDAQDLLNRLTRWTTRPSL